MGQFIRAEEVFSQVQHMPESERVKFFCLVARSAFQADNFSHQEVFGHLKDEMFSAQDAAEYLEVSMPTFRRYVQSKKISPSKVIGRSQLYSTGDLRKLKQGLRVR
jgi:excisionase family DNA binding protein